MRRVVLVGLAAALAWAVAVPSVAAAESCPPYEGATFPAISGLEDPEDYCWEVTLGGEQELRQIDDRHVGVFYNTGQQALVFSAAEAHDADGAAVGTTLAQTGLNLITLTVHHRAGNPAAGGAPFDYPVTPGAGWEGGFQTVEVKIPPTEQATNSPATPPVPTCEVPWLHGRTLKAAKGALRRSGCALGPVHSHGARVVRQYRPVGKTLPAGTEVGVKLGR